MKSKYLFHVILLGAIMLLSFSVYQVSGEKAQMKAVKMDSGKYTCPQHPEIVQDKPGRCPKCGMTLVEQREMSTGVMNKTCDSTKMNKDNMKMMNDTTSMKQHDKMMK